MSVILGLDVSTSIVGVCIVDSSKNPEEKGRHIITLDHIAFKGCNTMWEKADRVQQSLNDVKIDIKTFLDGTLCVIDRVVLEEPLMGFRPGMSSAQTISTLMRFNGIVSYIARNIFQKEPEYISAAHARKLCGIKLMKTALGGPQKEQVFRHMMANDLKHVTWPVKKSGKDVDWSRDACDAYVISRAASIMNK